jgi:hypothetical protein
MKLTSLAAAAAAMLTTTIATAPADAQPMRERTVVKTTVVERGHGRHMGWRNHHRWQRRHGHSRVCRVTVRHGNRHRVCTTRW